MKKTKKSEPAKGAMARTKAAEGAEQIRRIRLEDICPDPDQPRKLPPHGPEDDAMLADITASIEWDEDAVAPKPGRDIITPIEVRPIEDRADEGDPLFMIVDGERRWRAAKDRGFASIRAIVIDIAPADVLARQVLHAEATKPLSPIEKADAIARLAAAPKGKRKGPSAEELGFRIGCSAAEVRRSLAIASLCPEARAALAFGAGHPKGIGVTVAVMLSTIVDRADQIEATQHVLGDDAAQARWSIERFQRPLLADQAGFDPADPTLSGGVCEKCPHNTAAQRSLLVLPGDGAGKCAKKACYEQKRAEAWTRRKAAAEAAGAAVVEGDKAKEIYPSHWQTEPDRDDLVDLDRPCSLDVDAARAANRQAHTWRKVLGADVAPSVLVQDQRGVAHELITLADAAKRLEALGREEDAARIKGEAEEVARGGKQPSPGRRDDTWERERAARSSAQQEVIAALSSAALRAEPAHFLRFAIVLWLRIEEDNLDPDSVAEQVRPMLERRGIDVDRPETVDDDAYPPELPALLAWTAELRDPAELQALFAEMLSEQANVVGQMYARRDEDAERAPWTVVCRFAGVDFPALLAAKLDGPAAPEEDEAHAAGDVGVEEIDRLHRPKTGPSCRVCGCTLTTPCVDAVGAPCAWANVEETVCTVCAEMMEVIEEQIDAAHLDASGIAIADLHAQIDDASDEQVDERRRDAALAELLKLGAIVEADGLFWTKSKAPSPDDLEVRVSFGDDAPGATDENDCPKDPPCGLAGHHFDEECLSAPPPDREEPAKLPMPKPGDRVRVTAAGHLHGRLGTVSKLCGAPFTDRFYVDFDLLGKERSRKHLQLSAGDVVIIEAAHAPADATKDAARVFALGDMVEVTSEASSWKGRVGTVCWIGKRKEDVGQLRVSLVKRGEKKSPDVRFAVTEVARVEPTSPEAA